MLRATRLVARQAKLRQVGDIVAGVGAVVVAGEAGMGKSAVVRAATAAAPGVVVGRALPPPAPPLRPLAELAAGLERMGAAVDDPRLRVHRGALSLLLPGDITPPADATSPLHVGDALLALHQAARARTLVVEDLHWADDLTVSAIEYLADGAVATGLSLVVTLRPEGSPWASIRRLAQRRGAALVELAPLDGEGVRALAAACLGGDPPEALLDDLARAEGIPLLVEELLSAYERRGTLAGGGGAWRFDAGAAALPASVEEGVDARLGALDDRDRRVVQAAALLGREFDADLLASALGRDTVEEGLRRALDAGLLTAEPGGGRVRFAHALVRDAVAASASDGTARDLASRLLDRLEAPLASGQELETGAALAERAGSQERAASLLDQAGRRDLARGLPAAAASRFDQALARLPPGLAELAVRESLLQALVLAGDADRARREGALVRRQLVAAGAGDARRQACDAAVARAAANAGRWDEAEALLGTPDAPTPATDALGALVAFQRGRFHDAEAGARRAVADPAADPPAACEAAEVLGRLARRRDLDEALRWFELAAGTAELHGLALWRARALHELATVEQLRSFAIGPLEQAREAAIDAGAPGLVSAVDFHLAAVQGVRFEPEAALAAARRCLDTARRLGAARQEAWAWNLIGQAHAVGGERLRARAAADEALALAGGDAEIAGVAIGTARGLSSLLAGDRDGALAEWAEAIGSLRRLPGATPLPPWYLWPLLATAHDLEADGGARARDETEHADVRVATGPDGLWHLAVAVARGRAGDPEGAGSSARRSEERLASVPPFAGHVHLGRLVAAEAAVADGWGEPARWLQDAGAWFGERGFDALSRNCAALARRAGVRGRRRGRGESAVPADLRRLGVTSREMDVLLLVAQGLTNRQIAERLYVSPRTVKGHVESLLAKTGAANRTQLAGIA
ncbi:MAG TPA: LuxR C-terminal-related transcriptional regulator [Acidimicrobiales bacterium]|nr:LuxR C-terminal-related transcriptional regulator [Acidimicrobiales bacterium]